MGRRCPRLWKASCAFQNQPGAAPKPCQAPLPWKWPTSAFCTDWLSDIPVSPKAMGLPLHFRMNIGSGPFEARTFWSQASSGCQVLFNAPQSLEVSLLSLSFQPRKLKLEAVKGHHAQIFTLGQCECTCYSVHEWRRGAKNNLRSETSLGLNLGHERLKWKMLILLGSNHSQLFFFLPDAREADNWHRGLTQTQSSEV